MKKIIAILFAALAAVSFSSCSMVGGTGDGAAANGNSLWIMILAYGAIFAGIYFLLIRPQSKKKKQEQELRNNLEIGDEITTIGGIVGRVVSIKEETDSFVIETGADRVRMQFKRWALSSVDTDKPDATPAKKTKEKKEKKEKQDKNNEL